MRANVVNQGRAAASSGPPPASAGSWLVEDDDTKEAPVSTVRTEEASWRKAVTTRDAAPPRDASTCILWCAIALGALVRGYPLPHVGGNGRRSLVTTAVECSRRVRHCSTPYPIGQESSRCCFESSVFMEKGTRALHLCRCLSTVCCFLFQRTTHAPPQSWDNRCSGTSIWRRIR